MCEVGILFETVLQPKHVHLFQLSYISYYQGPPTSREITLARLELLDMLLSFNKKSKEEKSRSKAAKLIP
ncbi:hypothetical protein QNH00_gp01 [Yersinia phage PYps16N]|uniref:Uncharacterized protein n=1 Tax=Yersinia phage PYps16N TaxID=2801354 RepID=A0AAE7P795_9CAUD|nr:hypothetical protein QNH00_gp01 [Yersinia phage PYps16N]QQO91174.1 hypothetical protein ORF001 [Yersinia phage PYps16N]